MRRSAPTAYSNSIHRFFRRRWAGPGGVRGFISGTLIKKLGLKVESFRSEGNIAPTAFGKPSMGHLYAAGSILAAFFVESAVSRISVASVATKSVHVTVVDGHGEDK